MQLDILYKKSINSYIHILKIINLFQFEFSIEKVLTRVLLFMQ